MYSADLLKGRTILVTGGGSGLGLAMASSMGKLGARIAICGRTQERLESGKAELEQAGVSEVRTAVLDVRDYQAVGEVFKKFSDEGYLIDGLINNAAGNFYCASEDLTPNGFKTVVDIVLHGTFNCSQHFAKQLIENKKAGSIVNIVTTYTQCGAAFVLPSACAKAGVAAMTGSLAFEWAEYNIRVNAIAPGPFPTKGAWKRLVPDPRIEKMMQDQHPMKRFGEPDELGNLACFLMSDLSSYVNGEIVTIDGGERLRAGQFNFLAHLMPREELKKTFSAMKPQST